MDRHTQIEQIARHHSSWTSEDVKYALTGMNGLTGSLLEQAIDEWKEGLQALGWPIQQAVQFTGDMRRVLQGLPHRGRLQD